MNRTHVAKDKALLIIEWARINDLNGHVGDIFCFELAAWADAGEY